MSAFAWAFRLSDKKASTVAKASRAMLLGGVELTRREHDVLERLVAGDSNREIANTLGIREQTVKDHVSVLLRKFHVRRRVALAVAAVRAGL
jgi:DNA-binding NarL/FixJ family response regulator